MKYIIFLSAVIVLSAEFYNNAFLTVNPAFFDWFQKDGESLAVGRLVRSKLDGPFSEGGFLGWNHPDASVLPPNTIQRDNRFGGWGYDVPYHPNKFLFQYEALQQDFLIGHYEKYYSQSAGQSFLYDVLGSVFGITGSRLITVCRLLNAVLMALVLCSFLWWTAIYFGAIAATLGFISMLLSNWLIVYAPNMLFVSALFFAPLVAGLWDLHLQLKKGVVNLRRAVLVIGFSVFLKCILAGYDFILPTLVMAVIPVIFYGVLYRWQIKKLFFMSGIVGAAAATAVLLSLLLLVIQLAVYYQSWSGAIDYIITTSARRTYGNSQDLKAVYDTSRDISLWQIIRVYLNGYAIDLPYLVGGTRIRIQFGSFILAFVLASLLLPWLLKTDWPRAKALLIVTWLSLVSPLGWFIIFKYHAIIHPHMNFVLWHMPLMLFGVVLIGYVIQLGIKRIIPNSRSRSSLSV